MGELYSLVLCCVVFVFLIWKNMSICTYYLNEYIENILFISRKKSSVKNILEGRGVGVYHKKWWGLGRNHQNKDLCVIGGFHLIRFNLHSLMSTVPFILFAFIPLQGRYD